MGSAIRQDLDIYVMDSSTRQSLDSTYTGIEIWSKNLTTKYRACPLNSTPLTQTYQPPRGHSIP